MVDGVAYASVFRNALVGKVDVTLFVKGYVFQQCVTLDCIVYVGFAVLVEVDNLGVATALEVEHAVVVPTVFVVADKQTFGVGGQCGLAGTAQTEEDSRVFAFHIGVCGAVHACNALKRQVVVHHGEHTFLHFAAVPSVDDDLLAAGDVEHNRSFC